MLTAVVAQPRGGALMATVPKPPRAAERPYPTTDGRTAPESEYHKFLIVALIQTLKWFFASRRNVYAAGDLLLFYEHGNRRKHVSPDVFVVKGVSNQLRDNYLLWREGCAPQVVIEVTSASTRREDTGRKFQLYRDVLKVREYFLFDVYGEWLTPSLQGYRLWRGDYRPIQPVNGRLPSRELDLHLERCGTELRLWDPATQRWLPTPAERLALAEDENARLRRENEELRRRLGG
jgi:Uma2 family endonuclease